MFGFLKDKNNPLLNEYAKNPVNNYKMTKPDISQNEGNYICGDEITVYLKIKNNKIIQFSYDGNCSTITKACASFLSEIIENQNVDKILKRNYNTLNQNGLTISPKRKRSAIIALIASQNAIYKYKKINKKISFDDLL